MRIQKCEFIRRASGSHAGRKCELLIGFFDREPAMLEYRLRLYAVGEIKDICAMINGTSRAAGELG